MAPVIEKLRLATGPLHAELERRLDLVAQLASPPARRRVVARFHGLHAAAEPALQSWLGDLDGLDFAGRLRSARLADDLQALGLRPDSAALAPRPHLASRHEALGFFYVLEGSSLGGKVIAKAMAASGSDMTGLTFLDSYGPAAGERWRTFLAVLEREGRPAFQGAIVRGGMMGFAAARDWLCDVESEAA